MGVGAGLTLADFPFSSAEPFWQWVQLCEDGGIDSIWQTDRLVSAQPHLECMTVMAALAGATKRVKFGMNVACLGWREPLLLAKQCATIDLLSGGRLLPAFGVGSPKGPEWQALRLPPKGHGRRIDEALEILRLVWTEDSVDFDGEHYQLTGARIDPKPVQKRFPLWIGGSSKAAVRRTAHFGTGWLAGTSTPAETARVVAEIKVATAAAGRSIDDDHFGAGFGFHFGSWDDPVVQKAASYYRDLIGLDPAERIVVGGAEEILSRIAEFVEGGVFKFVLRPLGEGDDEVLDQTQRFIDEVQPELYRRS